MEFTEEKINYWRTLSYWIDFALAARQESKKCTVHNINGRNMVAYSQHGEEMDIIKNFMPKIDQVKDGTFVELGGFDGITYSNTKGIEDAFGFSGVLIEPGDVFVAMDLNRPNTQNFRAAISTKLGEVEFTGLRGTATAGTTEKIIEATVNGPLDKDKKTKEIKKLEELSHAVPGATLSNILQRSKLEYIDLLCIDVEGSELEVLKTMDWSIPVYIICIEMHSNDFRKDQQKQIRKILKKQGFTYKKTFHHDEFWINDAYFRKDQFV